MLQMLKLFFYKIYVLNAILEILLNSEKCVRYFRI